MGDPKKPKKKYKTPTHPWQKTRIEEESVLIKEYGLVNKKELWIMGSKLRKFKHQAKKYISSTTEKMAEERAVMIQKLKQLGLLHDEGHLDDVLSLNVRNILDRRLQTIVLKKNLAATMRQARQFITHKHITVDGTKMTSPSYIVSKRDENLVSFSPGSGLSNDEHPERMVVLKAKSKQEVASK